MVGWYDKLSEKEMWMGLTGIARGAVALAVVAGGLVGGWQGVAAAGVGGGSAGAERVDHHADPGMARMHELKSNPGMARMHELMTQSNPGGSAMRGNMASPASGP